MKRFSKWSAVSFLRHSQPLTATIYILIKNFQHYASTADNKLMITLTVLPTSIGWVRKKVVKKNFTSDPSRNVMNDAKFTAVMAGSITLKQYLEDQKILPTS